MSDQFFADDELLTDDDLEMELDEPLDVEDLEAEEEEDVEYEEISCEEVDRVVAALEDLAEGVQSENIQHYLEQAIEDIFSLVYDIDESDVEDELADEAA